MVNVKKSAVPKTIGKNMGQVAKFYTGGMIGGNTFLPVMPGKDFITDRMNPKAVMPMNPYPNY